MASSIQKKWGSPLFRGQGLMKTMGGNKNFTGMVHAALTENQ